MVSLKQLRYLDALETHRHFGKAAASCHVSQPALSMQIADLEAELGLALVERLPREVIFTPRGLEIAGRAREIIVAVNDLIEHARQQDASLTGPVRLGIIPSVAPYLLAPVLPHLRAAHPNIELSLLETQTAILIDSILQARIDIAIMALPTEIDGLTEMPLLDDPFVLAVPCSHPLAGRSEVTSSDVRHETVLMLEPGHCLRDQTIAFCQLVDARNVDSLGATNLATLIQLVASGFGITLLPAIAVPHETAGLDKITLCHFREPAPMRTIGLVWRRTSPRASEFALLGQLIRDCLSGNLDRPGQDEPSEAAE